METPTVLFSGSSIPQLAQAIATTSAIPLGKINIDHFNDHEIMLELLEDVAHKNAIIVQSTCPPVNDHVIELIFIANMLRNAAVHKITAIIPYFGYARQNQNNATTITPSSAQIIATILATAGVNDIITVDFHTPRNLNFFPIPCTNIYSMQIIAADITQQQFNNYCLVAPDFGSIHRTRILAALLNITTFAILDKTRIDKNFLQLTKITGQISGKNCILVDDIVDTAATICASATLLKTYGAKQIRAYCTHPILSAAAIQNIESSHITEVIVTNTIPLPVTAAISHKIRQLNIAQLIATVIANQCY